MDPQEENEGFAPEENEELDSIFDSVDDEAGPGEESPEGSVSDDEGDDEDYEDDDDIEDEDEDESEDYEDEEEEEEEEEYEDDEDDEDYEDDEEEEYDDEEEDDSESVEVAELRAEVERLKAEREADMRAEEAEEASGLKLNNETIRSLLDEVENSEFDSKAVKEFFSDEEGEEALSAIGAVLEAVTSKQQSMLNEKIDEIDQALRATRRAQNRADSFRELSTLGHPDAESLVENDRFQKWLKTKASVRVAELAKSSDMKEVAKVFKAYKQRSGDAPKSTGSRKSAGRKKLLAKTGKKKSRTQTIMRRGGTAEPTDEELDNLFGME